jgi:hypothetical protein
MSSIIPSFLRCIIYSFPLSKSISVIYFLTLHPSSTTRKLPLFPSSFSSDQTLWCPQTQNYSWNKIWILFTQLVGLPDLGISSFHSHQLHIKIQHRRIHKCPKPDSKPRARDRVAILIDSTLLAFCSSRAYSALCCVCLRLSAFNFSRDIVWSLCQCGPP